jgi:hypothetical protein
MACFRRARAYDFLVELVRSDFTRQFAPEKKHGLAPRQSRRFSPWLAPLLFETGSARSCPYRPTLPFGAALASRLRLMNFLSSRQQHKTSGEFSLVSADVKLPARLRNAIHGHCRGIYHRRPDDLAHLVRTPRTHRFAEYNSASRGKFGRSTSAYRIENKTEQKQNVYQRRRSITRRKRPV